MATERVSICVVGAAGLIGSRHTQHCLDEEQVKLSCIVDPTPAGAELSAKHELKLFTSVTAMLAARTKGQVEVDGAILATPNETHVPLAKELVAQGVHTLVEKPFCTDTQSGEELVALAKEKNTTVLCGHHRRFNPYIVNLKRIIDAGKLGQVVAIQGTWGTKKPTEYFLGATSWRAAPGTGGVMMINLVHDLDLLIFLLGPITQVYCHLSPIPSDREAHHVEESGLVSVQFSSGALGSFIFSDRVVSPWNFESATGENPLFPKSGQGCYKVMGTKGSAELPQLNVWHYEKGEKGSWTDELIKGEAPVIEDVPPFTSQLKNFVGVCRSQEAPGCSASDAMRTMRTMEALQQSARTGQPVVVEDGKQ